MNGYPSAVRHLRALRGGSQAHLIQADDDHFYALKSPDNPQTRRVLLNEYLSGKVFEHLRVATAKITPLNVSQSFVDDNANFQVVLHTARIPLTAGVYLGSRYSVNPEKVAIFDFLPGPLLPKITNVSDFLGAFVADQWLCNLDARQFVFFSDQSLPVGSARHFRALAVDHGMCLGGAAWRLFDSPLMGIYCQPAVYRCSSSVSGFEPWLERLNSIGEDHFDTWIKEMPPGWLSDDSLPLQSLVRRLLRRKNRVPALVQEAMEALPKAPDYCCGPKMNRALLHPFPISLFSA